MTTNVKAHLGLLSANIFFAINLSAVKYLTGNNYMKPFGMNVIRILVTVTLFWSLYLLSGKPRRIDRQDIPRFILCALTGIAINQMMFLKGLSMTYSIHAALLMLTTPILITISAVFILKEKLNFFKIVGLLMGVSGAVVLIGSGKNVGHGSNVLVGDALVLVNAIAYTAYFILVKPLMQKYDPVQVLRWIFSIAIFMVLPFGWNEFVAIDWSSFDWLAFTCIILIALGGTFLAYLFNIYGIKILGASVAGTYIYAQPVFAAIIAIIFLHEPMELYKIIAALLILGGVFLCNRKTKML